MAGLRAGTRGGLHNPHMYRDAYRDENGGHRHFYWRRRAVLALGLCLLGLLAWAFSGVGKSASPAPGNSQASETLRAGSHRSASVSPSPRADGTGPSLASPAASQSGAGPGPAGSCPPSAVVLSLFSSRPSYSIGQDPHFEVYIVSTASGTCTFNFGHGGLHLTVMWAGRVIWDSADCAGTDATHVERLSRGVPVQESITWNRTITLPGCIELASSVRPGTYEVQARTATGTSQVRTFKLR
jgi:hypothetical protein